MSADVPQPRPGTRRTASGVATSDVIVSAHVGGNVDGFPLVLRLHVPPGSTVADVTYGQGVFWRKVDPAAYRLLATDLRTGTDCRRLPYAAGSLDCVVLDPPYMEGLYRGSTDHLAGSGSHRGFRVYHANGATTGDGPRWHGAVLDLYARAGREAHRVLRDGDVPIVKCQDEVSANRQRLTHVEVVSAYEALGFSTKDLFVVVRPNRPGVSRLKRQAHARKNHSYFLVFVKARPARRPLRAAPGRPPESLAIFGGPVMMHQVRWV